MTQNHLEVTVLSKPSCVQCNATYRWLDENGYKDAYTVGDAVELKDALLELTGFMQAPVVRVKNKKTGEVNFWSGFNRDLLIKHLQVV